MGQTTSGIYGFHSVFWHEKTPKPEISSLRLSAAPCFIKEVGRI